MIRRHSAKLLPAVLALLLANTAALPTAYALEQAQTASATAAENVRQNTQQAGTPTEAPSAMPLSGSALKLSQLLEPISLGESDTLGAAVLGSPELLVRFYQNRQFAPLWTDPDYSREAIGILDGAADDGLLPADYHAELLKTLQNDDSKALEYELLLTDGIITLGTHLMNGKVNPQTLGRTWNYEEVTVNFGYLAKELDRHVREKSLAQALDTLRPQYQPYRDMKAHLKRMQTLAANQPFAVIPLDATIRPGKPSPSLAAIAERLTLLGYLTKDADAQTNTAANSTTASTSSALTLSSELLQAVKEFQASHSLKPDGVIGKGTMAALNVPFAERAKQIQVNLERARWLSADLSSDFLIVNLAGYQLKLFRENRLDWETDIIIGKVSSKTPLFKSRLKYMVVNPTWTVPRSISREIIWHLKKDPEYLQKKNFVLRTASGAPADSSGIDWQTVNPRSFPYWFVQQPSENNALGQIKFIFPNAHSIYLHDTPAKSLFSQEDRAFSHGCIRVKDPLVLAERLMSPAPNWSPDSLNQSLASGQTKQIFLAEPLDILIMYWTAETRDGKLQFYKDIYKRDQAVADALLGQRHSRIAAAGDPNLL
ncbi:L,D-transpeptidase family protein [Shewanella khirikhana]|uniref:Murein L,D-transpeptidase n=1 Tax=Shewanella khirikhana TaxID=1965282 RepID=A0ABM7D1A7_9GAMM|nr:L,D-transpeptidase family protein [Shewanella khirikhana]AZQ10071.1 murein L,D-transpeptidase [Shewanella khirikhana]